MYGPNSLAEKFPRGERRYDRHGDEVFTAVEERLDDCFGKRVGTVKAILVDRASGANRFLLIRTRGGRFHGVTLVGLVLGGGRVWTPQSAATINRGPNLPEHGALTARLDDALRQLYGLPLPPAGSRVWERRATIARAAADPATGTVVWVPGPRPT